MQIIKKPWGQEEVLEKNKSYMLKRLTMNAGHKCSLQYHNKKTETIYVLLGKLVIFSGSTENNLKSKVFNSGEMITIKPGLIHRMEAIEKSVYLEASTPEMDDVVRIQDDYARIKKCPAVYPTAGTGSRLGNKTKYINKSLLTIANKPIISHLIKKFPEECEFIIPLGFKGNLVKQFLEIAYPKKNFRFVNVEPFEGKGSGLSHTLKSCKKFLLKPFVFMSCDTFVEESIPAPLENWMAYDFKEECSSYRTINLSNQIVIEICEKGKTLTKNHFPYIGLAGIKDYECFWEGMDKETKSD